MMTIVLNTIMIIIKVDKKLTGKQTRVFRHFHHILLNNNSVSNKVYLLETISSS